MTFGGRFVRNACFADFEGEFFEEVSCEALVLKT